MDGGGCTPCTACTAVKRTCHCREGASVPSRLFINIDKSARAAGRRQERSIARGERLAGAPGPLPQWALHVARGAEHGQVTRRGAQRRDGGRIQRADGGGRVFCAVWCAQRSPSCYVRHAHLTGARCPRRPRAPPLPQPALRSITCRHAHAVASYFTYQQELLLS